MGPQQHHRDTNRKPLVLAVVLILVALLMAFFGLGVGSAGLVSVIQNANDPVAHQIIWDIRLPRTLGAWAAGALLALAGAVAQGLFRNPLADPFLLGSASGASFGVSLALVFFGVSPLSTEWLIRLGLTGAAFMGAVGAVFLTLLLARGVQHTLRLLLSGVVVGVVLGALSSLVMLMAPEVPSDAGVFTWQHGVCGLERVFVNAGGVGFFYGLGVVV
jgi:iron complex transport system permease protein